MLLIIITCRKESSGSGAVDFPVAILAHHANYRRISLYAITNLELGSFQRHAPPRDVRLYDFHPLVHSLVFRAKCRKMDLSFPAHWMLPVRGFFVSAKTSSRAVDTRRRGPMAGRLPFDRASSSVRSVGRVGERHV